MQPAGEDDVKQFLARLERVPLPHKMLLWALVQRDDDLGAAQARVAAWLGGSVALANTQLAEALAAVAPDVGAEDPCPRVRQLIRASGEPKVVSRTTKIRQGIIDRHEPTARRDLDEVTNGSGFPSGVSQDFYWLLVTLYPNLPGPEERLKALRHAIARGELDLKVPSLKSPCFDTANDAPGSVQKTYRRMNRAEQDRIIRLAKDRRNQRLDSSSIVKLDQRTRDLLERLYPDAKSDQKLLFVLLSDLSKRKLDLDKRAAPTS
jgi:hypothetical protein